MTVYFVAARQVGRVKIGYTCGDVWSRISSLKTSSPVDLEVMGTIVGDKSVERAWHRQWGGLRWKREWFYLELDLEVAIIRATRGRQEADEAISYLMNE